MKTVDNYELLKPLAQGGMAEIFLARQTAAHGFERLVVVKRVLPELARDQAFIASFIDEAKNGAQLSHPNIVQTIELGEKDGTYFIALEYIDGVDLATLLRIHRNRGQPMPVACALRIVCDVLMGLEFAHNAKDARGTPLGLVHRDATPSNVLVAWNGSAKVVDFGIAKATAKLEGRTRTGVVKGKLGYMAPEQLDGAALDRRVDQFAVGIMLFELLTNVHPFRGDSELQTVKNIGERPPPKLTELRPEVPIAVEAAIEKALAKDRDARFATCAAFQNALEEAAGTLRLSQLAVAAMLEPLKPEVEAEQAARMPQSDPLAVTTDRRLQPARAPGGTAIIVTPADAKPRVEAEPAAPAIGTLPRVSRTRSLLVGGAVIALAVVAAIVLRPSPNPVPPNPVTPPVVVTQPVVIPPPASQPLATPPAAAQPLPTQPTTAGVDKKTPKKAPAKATPSVPVATVAPGELKIVVKPWAMIRVDDREIGISPVPAQSVPAGKHRVTLSNKDLGKDLVREVDVPPGETITLRVDLMKDR